jgi:hypothetical protein
MFLVLNTADFMPGRDLFLLLVTTFQTLIKRIGGGGGGGGGESTSLSSTSTGSLVFSSSPLSTLSADVGSAGVTGADGDGDGNGDGNGDGDGTSIVFCLFFAIFAFLFTFFLGGYRIAEVGID